MTTFINADKAKELTAKAVKNKLTKYEAKAEKMMSEIQERIVWSCEQCLTNCETKCAPREVLEIVEAKLKDSGFNTEIKHYFDGPPDSDYYIVISWT